MSESNALNLNYTLDFIAANVKYVFGVNYQISTLKESG